MSLSACISGARSCNLVLSAARAGRALAERADEHRDTLFADHTYLQQAQPSTIGHYLTSFAYPVQRDAARLLEIVTWINGSPGGAGCVNGSRLVDRTGIVRRVAGLQRASSSTPATRCGRSTGWSQCGDRVQPRLYADLAGRGPRDLGQPEFDYVDLADGYSRASVLMPQKRNPYALSMIRGTHRAASSDGSTGFLAIQKSPSARSDSSSSSTASSPTLAWRTPTG